MGVVKNLMVRAGGDFSGLIRAANKGASSVKKMQTSVNRSFSAMSRAVKGLKTALGAVGIAVSFTAVVSAANDAREAFEEQATAEAKLQQVMRNTMGASQAEYRSILDLCSAQQRLGVIGDEVQLAGAQELATYLSMSSSLQKLIPVMNDMLAQQYGLNATQENAANIATMLGKVMNGQVGALSRYGYTFDEAQASILKYGNEAQRAAVLAEVVEQSVGGMNAALARTPAGRMQQLNNTLGDIKERFGQAAQTILTLFLPALQRVASVLSAVADWSNRVANTIAKVFGGKTSDSPIAYAAGLSSAADSAEDFSEGLDDAAASAKKLTALADFDKLHVIKFGSDSASSDSSNSSASATATTSGFVGVSDDGGTETIGALEKALEKLQALKEKLHFEELGEAFRKVGEAASYLGTVIGEKLGVVWDRVIAPIGEWAAEKLIAALERIAELITNLADLLDGKLSFSDFLEQLTPVEKALLAIAAIDVFVKLINGIGSAISWFTKLFAAVNTPLSGIMLTVGGLVLAVSSFVDAWKNGLTGVNAALIVVGVTLAAIGAIILGAPAAIALAIAAVVAAVAVAVLAIHEHWDEIRAGFKQMCEKISQIWDGIVEGISTAWNGMVEGIQTAITGVRNFIRSIWEGIANGAIDAFNAIKLAINSISLTAPSWLPVIGGKSWSPSLPMTAHISVPRLATGAVIPPNREFAAILGDQTSGVNIETPERLLRQVMREESGNSRIIELLSTLVRLVRAGHVIELNDRELGRTVRQLIDDMGMSGAALGF